MTSIFHLLCSMTCKYFNIRPLVPNGTILKLLSILVNLKFFPVQGFAHFLKFSLHGDANVRTCCEKVK